MKGYKLYTNSIVRMLDGGRIVAFSAPFVQCLFDLINALNLSIWYFLYVLIFSLDQQRSTISWAVDSIKSKNYPLVIILYYKIFIIIVDKLSTLSSQLNRQVSILHEFLYHDHHHPHHISLIAGYGFSLCRNVRP